ncbi:MAG: hypothetical protein D3916_02120 [Candidatus Electrothrix sp. MAN1_4]|nr:hypothetical protein [Candidatus Electrothrix sp. MAN1_4]
MVDGYDLGLIRGVEIIEDGRITLISPLTPDSIAKINSSNQRAQNYKETVAKIEQSKIGYLFYKLNSVRSVADFQKLSERQYQQYGLNGALHLFLPLLGTFLILAGAFWFIVAAFRVHILWGLACLLIPFASLFFLFLHWKAAAKPFILSVVGVLIAFSGVYFFDEKRVRLVNEHKGQPVARSVGKKTREQEKSRFSCQGKKHCAEMRSCAEAKFYLKNCPGVKIDGNRDGVPCERQWCK